MEEKKRNIDIVLEKAFAKGFTKEDIIVDGLVGTVGAIKEAAIETLATIEYCHSMGLATTCGLSNISFGLPERINVNSAFLSMAIKSHLTSAIMNPNQDVMVRTALSADLLMNHPEADIRYIEYMNEHAEAMAAEAKLKEAARESAASGAKSGAADTKDRAQTDQDDPISNVKNAVLKGRKGTIEDITNKALESGAQAKDILDNALIPAINEVGELFDKGKYFLPQLIASAETMEMSIGVLEPYLATGSSDEDAPAVVIATVEGDIHDIGKNLVVLMLKNYGFHVFDLGKNVPKETIVDTAIAEKASIIGLSALMTTTMNEMRNVVSYAKERGYKGKIMVGGAVVTEDFCWDIGADGYSADASEAVKVAKRIVQEAGQG